MIENTKLGLIIQLVLQLVNTKSVLRFIVVVELEDFSFCEEQEQRIVVTFEAELNTSIWEFKISELFNCKLSINLLVNDNFSDFLFILDHNLA